METVLMIVILAKLCGEDRLLAITEWAKHRQEELVRLLYLSRPKMHSHDSADHVASGKEEIERLEGEYNRQGEQGTKREQETRTE